MYNEILESHSWKNVPVQFQGIIIMQEMSIARSNHQMLLYVRTSLYRLLPDLQNLISLCIQMVYMEKHFYIL